ncbi:hypothetical protein D9M68_883620 [compost metagenome]
MVKALASTDTIFTRKATLETSEPASREKIRPISRKNGAPAGWGTCSLKAQAINSPQSQKLAVGSAVSVKVTRETSNTNQPPRLFSLLKLISINRLFERNLDKITK